MSAQKPDDYGDTDLRSAFSTKAWRRAVDDRVRRFPRFFDFLWRQRVWWLIATALTFVLPVLQNDNTAALSYSRSIQLYGFDLLVPMLSKWTDNNVVYVSSFSINPLALVIYGLAVLHLYLIFVETRVSPLLTLWHGVIQTVATISFPFLDIPILTHVLKGFDSYWHVQPPLAGFWILVMAGLLLSGAAYGRILRGMPVSEDVSQRG